MRVCITGGHVLQFEMSYVLMGICHIGSHVLYEGTSYRWIYL